MKPLGIIPTQFVRPLEHTAPIWHLTSWLINHRIDRTC